MRPIDKLIGASLRKDIPVFGIGDTVLVNTRIKEADKEKIHEFKGVVIARKGVGISETIVVRKLSYGEGIERTFYLNSPAIKSIEISKKGKVRKAKLYYLRGKIGKKAKVKEMELIPVTAPAESPVEAVKEESAVKTEVNQ